MQYYRPNDEIVPGYILQKFLGRGGFGEVWKATGPGGVEVAIKTINLQGGQGLKEFRSLRLFRRLKHPNLVPLFGFWLKDENGSIINDEVNAENSVFVSQTASEMVIAMGLGEKSLLDRLKECKKVGAKGIPAMELLDYMEDTARAIDYLNGPTHDFGKGQVGIQHCDIKPGNILIVSGAAQVCDFGLARVLSAGQGISATGAAFTPAYLAPEMIDNKPSNTTDQYSLAITYLELRTGALPFSGNNPSSALAAHLSGNLDLTKLPPLEQKVIRRATAWKPEDRFPTTVEMVQSLRQAVRHSEKPRSATDVNVEESVKPGQELVPGFKLVRLIGKGGYGEVWEAIAPGGKHCALKVIRNLDASQSVQEFRVLELMKALEHPNLMELQAYWLLDPTGQVLSDDPADEQARSSASMLVISTQLAVKNLAQRLKEHQKNGLVGIPAPELLGYIRQTADALDYLNAPQHTLGERVLSIQHRDIKPENVLLTRNGIAKVSDFGLAKMVEGTSATIHSQSRGMTVAYAAPEMFKGSVTRWTDQYSLAITYYKLRTGALPFDHNQPLYTLILVHTEGRLDFSLLGDAEQDVLRKATGLEPTERYASCLEFAAALEAACELRQDLRTTPTGSASPDYWDKPPTVPSVPGIQLPGSGSVPRASSTSPTAPVNPPALKGPSGPAPKAPSGPAPKSPSGPPPRSGPQPKTVPAPPPVVATGPTPSQPTAPMPAGTGSTLPPGATVAPTSCPVSLDDEDEEWVSGIEDVPGPKVDLQGRATQAGAHDQLQPSDSLEISSGFSDDDPEGKLTKTDNPFITMQPPSDSPSGSTHRGGGGGASSTQVGQSPVRVTVQAEVEEGDSGPTPGWQGDGLAGTSAVAARPRPQADRLTAQGTSGKVAEPEAQPWRTGSGSMRALPDKKRRVKLLVTITLVLGAVLLAVGGWLWFRPTAAKQLAQIQAALDARQYSDAINKIDDASRLEEARKKELRDETRKLWLSALQVKFKAKPEDETTVSIPLKEFLGTFPQDPEGTRLHLDVVAFYLPTKLDRLVKAEQFVEAYQELDREPAFASTENGKAERKRIDGGWLGRAAGLKGKQKLTAAMADLAALIEKSPEFSDAKKARDQLEKDSNAIADSVKALYGAGKFEEALDRLSKEWSDADKLRDNVFAAWLGKARDLSKGDEASQKNALAMATKLEAELTSRKLDAAAVKSLVAELKTGGEIAQKRKELRERIAGLMNKNELKDYLLAAGALRDDGSILPDSERGTLASDLSDAWVKKAVEIKDPAKRKSELEKIEKNADGPKVKPALEQAKREIREGGLRLTLDSAFASLANLDSVEAEKTLNAFRKEVEAGSPDARQIDDALKAVGLVQDAVKDPSAAAYTDLVALSKSDKWLGVRAENLRSAVGELLERRVARTVLALPASPDEAYWRGRLAECAAADKTPGAWVLASRLENLAELRLAKKQVNDADLERAREALGKLETTGEVSAYARFARAVGEFSAEEHAEAAKHMLAAFAGKEPSAALAVPRRKQTAAVILRKGADRLRTRGTVDQPFGSPEKAAEAYDWLSKAEALAGKDADPSRTAALALAAWYRSGPDSTMAGERAAQLVVSKAVESSLAPLDAYRVLLIHAATRGAQPEERVKAVESYLAALTRAQDLLRQSPDNPPLIASLRKDVYKPASEKDAEALLGPAPADDLKRKTAELQSRLARTIKSDPVPWEPLLEKDAREHAADLYRHAFKLANRPEDLVAESFLRYQIGKRSPEDMDADADTALKLNKNLSSANALKAYAILGLSRSKDDLATRITMLTEAEKFCREAEGLLVPAKDPEEASDLYRAWSSINLEKGNYLTDKDARKKCITEAVSLATRAKNLNEKNLDAWDALAYALEDVASQLGETKKFDEVIKAFDRAVVSSGFQLDRIRPYVGRARARFKWGQATGDKKHFDDAERELKAIFNQVQAEEKLEAVEAYSLLADIARERRKDLKDQKERDRLLNEADDWLVKAQKVSRSENVKSKGWEESVLASRCNLLMSEANQRAVAKKNIDALLDRIEKANADLEKLNQIQGVINRAQIAVLSGKPTAEVVGILKEKFTRPLRMQDKLPNFHLVLLRAEYRMASRPPDADGALADAKEAEEMLKNLEKDKSNEAAVEGVYAIAKAVKGGTNWGALHRESLDHFAKAVQKDPEHAKAWIWRWQHARQLWLKPERTSAETDQARALMREAEKRMPNEAPMSYWNSLLDDYQVIVGERPRKTRRTE